jgi:hypothetical protein
VIEEKDIELRKNQLEKSRQKVLVELGLSVMIGDTLIHLSGGTKVAIVEDIEINEESLKSSVVVCRVTSGGDPKYRWGTGRTERIPVSEILQYKESYLVLRNVSFDEVVKEAEDIMSGLKTPNSCPTESSETALMSTSKSDLIALSDMLVSEQQKQQAVYAVLRNRLENMKSDMYGVLRSYDNVIGKIKKVIRSIELYLGIEEDLVQIQDGEPCISDCPITIRQHELYMDIEAADPWNSEKGGITGDDIEPFLNWLVKFDEFICEYNYKTILPERGICVFRIRQYKRENYTKDPLYAHLERMKDRNTVLIIRNGERLYCIQTDLNFDKKLFPDKDEIMKIIVEGKDVFGHKMSEEERAKVAKDKLYGYKIQMLVLQGILDRTDIFKPFSDGLNLFNPDIIFGGKISLIYDFKDSSKLTDGMPDFESWRKSRVSDIKAGSRIFLFGRGDDYDSDRFFRWYSHRDHPDYPCIGIYLLEYDKEEDAHFIRYKPSEGVRSWDWSVCGNERKNKLRFQIFPEKDDFVVCYDTLRNDEMDWIKRMIVDRRNRYYNKYIALMKPLYELYRLRKEDIESEYHLLRLISGISGVTDETVVLDAILWWKTKNKYKRPIGEDEAKAVRMIASKVKRIIGGVK